MDKPRWVNEADQRTSGCEWPKCKCPVPSYALSGHNRVHFCVKITEAINKGELKARQSP